MQQILAKRKPLPCSWYADPELLGQTILHMQFTNTATRVTAFEAMQWWQPRVRLVKSIEGQGEAGCEHAAKQLHRFGKSGLILVGSAMGNASLVCLRANASSPTACPCCWIAPRKYRFWTDGCHRWNTKK